MAYQAPKGTKDVLPQESYQWQYVETMIREIVAKYGFLEARTPVIEHTELFLRGVGNTTDIVQKEMYTFQDKGDRSITLKPEGTAGIARMFVENSLFVDAQPTKIYYLNNPVLRYEKPQAGRLREHHQFGIEFLGAPNPSADAECITVALELLNRIGCTDLTVKLNSIGCPQCRPLYQNALREYLHSHMGEMCETCKTRFEQNPLRILDCKEKRCHEIALGAPSVMDYICEDCAEHMQQLRAYLDALNINYQMDPMLVRGLDYYTKTVFEIVSDKIGAQGTVCGGGRYDGLISELGGPDMPAVGFGLGMERLLLLIKECGIEIPKPVRYDLYLAAIGDRAKVATFVLASSLRKLGCRVEIDHMARSVKAQMKYANKVGATCTMVLGDDEIAGNRAKLHNMNDGTDVEIALVPSDIANVLMRR